MKYNELFRGMKPLIGMIHTNSTDEYTMLELAKRRLLSIRLAAKYGAKFIQVD